MGEPTYQKIIGPDGNAYAVAGEVKINLSPVPGDSAATRRKAVTLENAAMAPAGPSGADYGSLDAIRELGRSAGDATDAGRTGRPYAPNKTDSGSYLKKRTIDYYV